MGNTDEIPELIARSAALASICKVSADELCQLSGASHWQDARYYLRDLGCDTTIISLGADGALLITAEGSSIFPHHASMLLIPREPAMLLSAACCSPFPAQIAGIMPCWRKPSAMPMPAALWR